MRKSAMAVLVPLAVFGSVACASLGGGGAGETYAVDAGLGTTHDIVRFTSLILNRHQFEIERADTSAAYLMIETHWRGRYPLSDEIDRGVVEAMTRLTIHARSRSRSTAPGKDLRTVEIRAENMVRLADSLSWVRGYITPMFRDFIDELGNEIELELSTAVRRF